MTIKRTRNYQEADVVILKNADKSWDLVKHRLRNELNPSMTLEEKDTVITECRNHPEELKIYLRDGS